MLFFSNILRYVKESLVIPSAFPKVSYKRKITDQNTLFKRCKHYGEDINTEYWIYGGTKYIDVYNVNLLHKHHPHESNKKLDLYICFHANGETCLDMVDYMYDYIMETKYTGLWLFIEFPGYGFNDKESEIFLDEFKKSILEIYYDIIRLLYKVEIKIKSTTLVGRSIGTAFAIWLSTKIKTSKMLLLHPFTSILEVALGKPQRISYNNGKFMPSVNILDNFSRIKKTRAKKILIIHSKNDPMINYEHSKVLYNIVEHGGHANITLWLLPYGEHSPDCLIYLDKTSNVFYNIGNWTTTDENSYPKNPIFYKYINGHVDVSLYEDILKFIKY